MKRLAFAAMAACALATPALAHHSFAMFDRTKTITLTGTVKQFQFTNPHSWLQLVVAGPNGAATEWSLELNALVGLRRAGWRANTLLVGDKVTVAFHPIRDGSHAGQLQEVTLANGKTLSGQANGPGATGPGSTVAPPPKPL